MLITLIKNNFKLVLRRKIFVLFMVILPIVLTALLSSAFSEYLTAGHKLKTMTVGYKIDKESSLYDDFGKIKKEFKDNKIILKETNLNDATEKINSGKMASFIDIKKDNYVIHRKGELSIENMAFEGSFSTVVKGFDSKNTVINYLTEKKINSENYLTTEENNFVDVEKIKADPIPSSTNYYGITEIIFVIWCGMLIGSNLDNDERKCGLKKRISLTTANPLILMLGRIIPVTILVIIQILIAVVVSNRLMGVCWGPNIVLSAFMIFLEIIASISIGLAVSMVIKNPIITNVLIFVGAFFLGLIGGSFETYMYNFVSDSVAKVSPLYYLNRTLVEFTTKGYSDYTIKAVIYLCVLTVVSLVIGTIMQSKEGVEA